MASFWDEIQKQYANAEDRVNRAKEAGINMLARKGDMINQGFNNALAVLTGQGNMLGQVANIQDSMYGRAIQQDQFGQTFRLDEKRLKDQVDQWNVENTIAQKNANTNALSATTSSQYTQAQIDDMKKTQKRLEEQNNANNKLASVEAQHYIKQFPGARAYYESLLKHGVLPAPALESTRQWGYYNGWDYPQKTSGFQIYSNDAYNVGPVREQPYGGKTKKVSFKVEG